MEIGGEEERKLLSIVDSGAAAAAAPKAFYHISSPAKLPKVALSIFSLSLARALPLPFAPFSRLATASRALPPMGN